ncbi:MAG: hypothetical protein ACTSRC_22425 [Candidatus Helarchaeota archaeon]
MDIDSGRIDDLQKFTDLFQEGKMTKNQMDNLVPFEINQVLWIDGCKFVVRGIRKHPENLLILEGRPKI